MLTNPVLISVASMVILALLNANILIALLLAALIGGVISGIPVADTMNILIGGMGGNAETALSYVLLGALATAINKTGAAEMLANKIGSMIKDRRYLFLILIALISSTSQNLIPVHIAFIPILIPPLLKIMNDLKLDRRAVACSLTYGLKAPYLSLPVGFGLVFHRTIANALTDNGLPIEVEEVWKPMLFAGAAMTIGLFISMFITYRKPREYEDIELGNGEFEDMELGRKQWGALAGAATAFLIQIITESLPISAILGLGVMFLVGSIKWEDMDEIIYGGVNIMGFIAFVMMVASGYGAVIRATGGVEDLVATSVALINGSKLLAVIIIIILGLIITMGIGSSFATVPILSVVLVPIAIEMGFSTNATIALVGIASAVGDAGSPASDSTLGPTAGLSADGQHDHIRDTVIPTFTHFSIPLMISALIAGLVL